MSAIVPVVEGDGEVEAFPVLLRKVLAERFHRYDVEIATPLNARGRSRLVRYLENYIQYATMTPRSGAVLVLLDAHGDCPKRLVPELAKRCQSVCSNIPTAIVCVKQEYEAWFLASLNTIAGKPIKGKPGVSPSAEFNRPVESLQGVKEWLTKHMSHGRAYKETSDQAPLTECLDINQAYRRSRSFRRLCHAVEELLEAMDKGCAIVTPRFG